MGALTCFPLEFLLDIPTSGDHIHGMDIAIDPMGLMDVLSGPMPFAKGYVLLGILRSFI
jgi:hypothetical protein